MNSKDRIAAAFRHEPTDRNPICHIGFSSDIASALLGREAYVGGGSQQWREAVALWNGQDAHDEFLERSFRDAIDIALLVDNDIVRPRYWRYPAVPTKRLDEYTFLYEYGDEENWVVLTHWDSLLRLEELEGQEVHILGTVSEVKLGDRGPTKVMLGRRMFSDFPLIFFDKDVFGSSRIGDYRGEFVRVKGQVTRYRNKHSGQETLQIQVKSPSQIQLSVRPPPASPSNTATASTP